MSLQLGRHSDHLLFGLLLSGRADWVPEWRLQADYNDVKVRHGDGMWGLSDRDAGSLRRAGVKCHRLSGGNAPGIWEITSASPLQRPCFVNLLFCSFSPPVHISLVIASSALISTPFCSYSAVLFFLYYLLMHPNQLHTCELYLYVFVASSHVWFAERWLTLTWASVDEAQKVEQVVSLLEDQYITLTPWERY